MKVRTVIISVAAGAVLVGGVGYAAYYSMRGQEAPVEVAPVSNVSYENSWFSYENSMSGLVTSKVSQTVSLDSDYEVDEVYVKEGEEVKEGDPLFSYDMTLEEIELEAQEIELQSLQLQLTKYQKDLQKYQSMHATASLETVPFTLTAAAAEEIPSDEILVESVEPAEVYDASAEEAAPAEESVISAEDNSVIDAGESSGASLDTGAESGTSAGTDTGSGSDSGGIVVEDVETVTSTNSESEDAVYRNAVQRYESLMMSIELFLDENGNLDYSSSIVSALYKAVDFYQKNLANRIQEEVVNEYGETVIETTYEIKRNVIRVLSDEELTELEGYVDRMNNYVAIYESTPATLAETEQDSEEEAEDTYQEETSEQEEGTLTYFSNEEGTNQAGTDSNSKGTGQEDESTDADSGADTGTKAESIADSGLFIDAFIGQYRDISNKRSVPEKAELEQAINYYIDTLGSMGEIFTTDIGISIMELESYSELRDSIVEYLNLEEAKNLLNTLGVESPEDAVTKLENMYKKLCIEYCICLLRDEYTELEEDAEDAEKTGDSSNIADSELWEEFYENLKAVYETYLNYLSLDGPKDDINKTLEGYLLDFAEEFGMIDEQTESETEPGSGEPYEPWQEDGFESEWEEDWDEEDWEDWDEDDEEQYTAEELAEMITELEQEIKETELSIRECELELEQEQRVVDGKIVTSDLNGTVISIGDDNGESDDEYFVKVTDMFGLYAKGVISELELETVNVGDVVSGITENGESFTAVIKEVADYPEANGEYYTYGSGNSNATYYTFTALIDDPEGIEEGSAELTLSAALAEENDSIWLDLYFVRTDSAGNNYVYVEGENGKLEMRFVSTGATDADWAVEITGGLSRSDKIAFPYGDNVYDGAPTKEVSNLDSMYEE